MDYDISINKVNLSTHIINGIKRIDDIEGKRIHDLSWYVGRYSSDDVVYTLNDKDEIVGYLLVAGISKQLYKEIKSGKFDDNIEFDSKYFIPKSKYKYIESINILDKYRNKGYGTKLLYEALKDNNIRVIAVADSVGGYNLAKKLMINTGKTNASKIFEKNTEIDKNTLIIALLAAILVVYALFMFSVFTGFR